MATPLLSITSAACGARCSRAQPFGGPKRGLGGSSLPSPLSRRVAQSSHVVCTGKGFGKKAPEPPKADEPEVADAFAKNLDAIRKETPGAPKQPEVRGIAEVNKETGEVQEVPAIVYDRMLGRILTFAGIPMLFGFGTGPFLYWLKLSQGMDVPKSLAIALPTTSFGLAIVGISYAVISTSWDARQEGSGLGINEFKTNLPILLSRFGKK